MWGQNTSEQRWEVFCRTGPRGHGGHQQSDAVTRHTGVGTKRP